MVGYDLFICSLILPLHMDNKYKYISNRAYHRCSMKTIYLKISFFPFHLWVEKILLVLKDPEKIIFPSSWGPTVCKHTIYCQSSNSFGCFKRDFICFCLCSTCYFKVGGTSLEKGDATFFHASIRIQQRLKKKVCKAFCK